MAESSKKGDASKAEERERRLAAALKANIGKRKAQARARAEGAPASSGPRNEVVDESALNLEDSGKN